MNVEKEHLKNGDSLICFSDGLIGKGIHLATGAYVNHAAKVIKVSGLLMVVESQKNGTNPKTFENWLREYGYDYRVHRYTKADKVWGKYIRERALSKSGITGYAFAELLIYQPIFQLTGKWYGKTGVAAEKRMYCSKFVGWVDKVPEWWTLSPKALEEYYIQSDEWTLIEP